MRRVLGWDIGGANVKLAYAEGGQRVVAGLKVASRFLPLWRVGKEALEPTLVELRSQAAGHTPLDLVGTAVTAELCDVYSTKKEGVNHVLDSVEHVHSDTTVLVLGSDGNLHSLAAARSDPLGVAGANWPAAGWLASRLMKTCVVVDVGSTTTSIIPVVEGRVAALGRTDLEKLQLGELVYTGALRTNVATVLRRALVQGHETRPSSELFAVSGDAHLLLANIAEQGYTTETADGRGRTVPEARARLARVVCADDVTLDKRGIEAIAREVYEAQLRDISGALAQVYRDHGFNVATTPVITAGIGRSFLARKAALLCGCRRILDLGDLTGLPAAAEMAPAVGLCLMALCHAMGGEPDWTRLSK